MNCPHCGQSDLLVTLTPKGPHHARLDCPACGRFLKWLPRPAVPLADLALPPGIPDGTPLPELVGSPAQVAFAAKLRPVMLRKTAPFVTPDQLAAMRTITASSWWISQKDRQWVDDIRWPKEWEPKPKGVLS